MRCAAISACLRARTRSKPHGGLLIRFWTTPPPFSATNQVHGARRKQNACARQTAGRTPKPAASWPQARRRQHSLRGGNAVAGLSTPTRRCSLRSRRSSAGRGPEAEALHGGNRATAVVDPSGESLSAVLG